MADQLNEYAIEATKQWNASAGNDLSKKPQSASQSNGSAVQSKSTALMKLEPDVLFTELV